MPSMTVGGVKYDTFNVYLNGKEIDNVYFLASNRMTTDEVRKSLINHDGYDARIKVVKRNY